MSLLGDGLVRVSRWNKEFLSLYKYFIDPELSSFVRSCRRLSFFSSNLIGYSKQALKSTF